MEQKNIQFHDKLKLKMDKYVHLIYKISKNFPKEELYGVTSQLRRATLSVILNYIEGYARRRQKVHKNFLEISYGSLKESKYLIYFSLKENYLNKENYQKANELAEEIGAMLWTTMRKL
jgi:four helix bundle protein